MNTPPLVSSNFILCHYNKFHFEPRTATTNPVNAIKDASCPELEAKSALIGSGQRTNSTLHKSVCYMVEEE
jgi:hypothetical protein